MDNCLELYIPEFITKHFNNVLSLLQARLIPVLQAEAGAATLDDATDDMICPQVQ